MRETISVIGFFTSIILSQTVGFYAGSFFGALSLGLIVAETYYYFIIQKSEKRSTSKKSSKKSKLSFDLALLKTASLLINADGVVDEKEIAYTRKFFIERYGLEKANAIFSEFKVNPPPNLSCRYFTHSTETLIWAAKNAKSKHVYNYKEMKAITGRQMKNTWQDLFWSITAPKQEEKKYGKHPTQKPVELINRIISSSSREGCIVLDPFNGHGTSGIVAFRLKRGNE